MLRGLAELLRSCLSLTAVAKRLLPTRRARPRLVHAMRSVSHEGRGVIRHHQQFRQFYASDRGFRGFFDRTTTRVPDVFRRLIRTERGTFRPWLRARALQHGPLTYLKSSSAAACPPAARAKQWNSPPRDRSIGSQERGLFARWVDAFEDLLPSERLRLHAHVRWLLEARVGAREGGREGSIPLLSRHAPSPASVAG
jgi:hypothetical protein